MTEREWEDNLLKGERLRDTIARVTIEMLVTEHHWIRANAIEFVERIYRLAKDREDGSKR